MLYDPAAPEVFGYRGEFFFLSNFYPHMDPLIETFQGEEIHYPTSEHAYQASKSLTLRVRQNIATMPSPAKPNGRGVPVPCARTGSGWTSTSCATGCGRSSRRTAWPKP